MPIQKVETQLTLIPLDNETNPFGYGRSMPQINPDDLNQDHRKHLKTVEGLVQSFRSNHPRFKKEKGLWIFIDGWIQTNDGHLYRAIAKSVDAMTYVAINMGLKLVSLSYSKIVACSLSLEN